MKKEKWELFSEEELKNILLNSKTFKEVALKLGYKGCNGRVSEKIRNIARQLNITTPYIEKEKPKKITEYIGKWNGDLEVVDAHDGTLYCKCHLCNKEELHLVSIANWSRTKSCGCRKTTRFLEGHYEDLSGQIFGNFKAIDINKEYSEKYNKTYWNCLCLKCNKNIVPVWAWDLKIDNRNSCGCSDMRKSKGEEKIASILTELDISFYREYTFKDFYTTKGHPYRFDFAILNDDKTLKCLIEYHGKQHYQGGFSESVEEIQKRDKIKRNYCKENNISLIEISYMDYDKIDNQYLLNKINEVILCPLQVI